MVLAAPEPVSDTVLAHPMECGDCRMFERTTVLMVFSWEFDGNKNGVLSQVNVKHRPIISVYVHIHGALLRRHADGAVLQGKGRARRHVLSVCSLVVQHVDKDGGRGDGPCGGALIEGGWRDQVRTQTRPTIYCVSIQTG